MGYQGTVKGGAGMYILDIHMYSSLTVNDNFLAYLHATNL